MSALDRGKQEVEDDSSERILKQLLRRSALVSDIEVEDDSSERILKPRPKSALAPRETEVEDDSSERILKHRGCACRLNQSWKWKTILQREY